ncbi:hypothetical protein YC2023_023936 [Brassica napus]
MRGIDCPNHKREDGKMLQIVGVELEKLSQLKAENLTRDQSEHVSEGHQVANRVMVFGLGCCSPYVNSAVAKARTQGRALQLEFLYH